MSQTVTIEVIVLPSKYEAIGYLILLECLSGKSYLHITCPSRWNVVRTQAVCCILPFASWRTTFLFYLILFVKIQWLEFEFLPLLHWVFDSWVTDKKQKKLYSVIWPAGSTLFQMVAKRMRFSIIVTGIFNYTSNYKKGNTNVIYFVHLWAWLGAGWQLFHRGSLYSGILLTSYIEVFF